MVIAVDFDGTCVSHEFPEIGADIGAIPILKELVSNGHKLILYTMRSNKKEATSDDPDIIGTAGDHLTAAVNWFVQNGIPLYGIQRNPTQDNWTQSPKCYAELYIDDAAIGCPLKFDISKSKRHFVDWQSVRQLLRDQKIIK